MSSRSTSRHTGTLIPIVLLLCGAVSAQEAQRATAPRAADAPPSFGMGSGGRPTPRRLAASLAATRAVALCSGLWDGGRSIDQINEDNGGAGGTETMKTDID